jgi:hypothetical protein
MFLENQVVNDVGRAGIDSKKMDAGGEGIVVLGCGMGAMATHPDVKDI